MLDRLYVPAFFLVSFQAPIVVRRLTYLMEWEKSKERSAYISISTALFLLSTRSPRIRDYKISMMYILTIGTNA
jgi:hypothetical protein